MNGITYLMSLFGSYRFKLLPICGYAWLNRVTTMLIEIWQRMKTTVQVRYWAKINVYVTICAFLVIGESFGCISY